MADLGQIAPISVVASYQIWAIVRRHLSVRFNSPRVAGSEGFQLAGLIGISNYDQWRDLVIAMRRFPQNELARRLRYISARKSSLAYRMGLFTGSVQRLGVLPLLAILYVQFKDWRFGEWQALGQMHMLGSLLLWTLFLAYLLSWWLVGMGTRWDAYEALLIEATCDE